MFPCSKMSFRNEIAMRWQAARAYDAEAGRLGALVCNFDKDGKFNPGAKTATQTYAPKASPLLKCEIERFLPI